jgi:hypothetical protein
MTATAHDIGESAGIRATLNYVARSDEPLYNFYAEPPADRPPSNEVYEPCDVLIRDMRVLDGGARLDREGFELTPFATAMTDIYDPIERDAIYAPEIEALVKRKTGASWVVVFNHFLRGEEAQRRAPGTITLPASIAHVDYTHDTGPRFFDNLMGEEADRLRGRRFALINVWRPIRGPLRDRPLALCDVASVADDDLMVCSTVARRDAGGSYALEGEIERSEIYSVARNSAHRWY